MRTILKPAALCLVAVLSGSGLAAAEMTTNSEPGKQTMQINSYYPVLAVEDVTATGQFYREAFGFVPAFENDWYIHLTHPENPSVNLAILQAGHETIPGANPNRAQGLLINFEVADVDALYARFQEMGLTILQPLRDEAFGQRHFIMADPNGVMVDVITPIPPSAEFTAQYSPEALPN
ncbi:VOC family protein [Aestuariispira insulae]|uniref:Putative glyoxalase superfamily protein PhnB n=1 Tax=Aestuariispira insulae TaxID=1461337 RepID=A0A3D9HK63_9PROT|nr:VOC family protein [Aestuariispira insulae]RED49902.1 putative glyoxalase superfamily protein PhnB [Aestuariispira insulae]